MSRPGRWFASPVVLALVLSAAGLPAQVCNVKVVTDASPDYSDMTSMVRSITSGWPTAKEKMWALYYWNHKARKQTNPIILHGLALTDPIRQFNDYGFMMCSTISGANCSIWDFMGCRVKYWDVVNHTVCEVEYDGKFHMYDNSVSAIYTLCDGTTIAGVEDLGKTIGCPASGGKAEFGHIVKYHCLNATSPNGYVTGCDMDRSLDGLTHDFPPRKLMYRPYYNDWDRGHRYILNLRAGEVYTRCYHRGDADSPNQVPQGTRGFKADPAYFVPNESNGLDAETTNPRYFIRANGVREFVPALSAEGLSRAAHSLSGAAGSAAGVVPLAAGRPGEVIFKIEGANVITSLRITGTLFRRTEADAAAVSISTTNGLSWVEAFKAPVGESPVELKLVGEVNGAYEALVKVTLLGRAAPADAALKSVRFETITQLNRMTQPKLNVGRNTVYVGAGDPSESIVLWPELQAGRYKPFVFEEKNTKTLDKHMGYQGVLFAEKGGEEAYVVFKVDAPRDITRVNYGGRFYNRGPHAHIDLRHSFDGGRTWQQSWTLTDTKQPWDTFHFETVDRVPPGTCSVLFKYLWNADEAGTAQASLYAVRMEVNHKPADEGFKPLEVTFTWWEPQEGKAEGKGVAMPRGACAFPLVKRSHTQVVDRVPLTYTINVGGADHPILESLRICPRGAAGDVTPGYSDGKDAGGEKWAGKWETLGTNFALGKKYTLSAPLDWGSKDPDGTKLTDGIVGANYWGGGVAPLACIWGNGKVCDATVDLGRAETFSDLRVHISGYIEKDMLKGEVEDKVEALVSNDGNEFRSLGFFDTRLRWKDLPVNFMYPDEETLKAGCVAKRLDKPETARFVRFRFTASKRYLACTEIQVFDRIDRKPFDMRIALPEAK